MKRAYLCLLALFVALACAGCGPEGGIEDLLSLPQLSDEYLELQRVIDGVINAGAVYSAPTAGSHRQSVQLYDINGDGVEEALAFFATSGERPLKIYIFRKTEASYETAAVIEGDGTSIKSISYTDMDGDGWTEAVVGWGMGGDLQMLTVYSLKSFQAAPIATADYTHYTVTDMNGNGRSELLVVRHSAAEKTGTVELYAIGANGETESSAAKLSAGMETIEKLSTGGLKDMPSALFVDGSLGGTGLVTDVFTYTDGTLANITLSPETGVSEGTVRGTVANCRDLNGDGVIEVPIPRALPGKSETVYRVLDWYGYNSRGKRTIALTTYHNYSDGWYLLLPNEWGGNDVSIRRETGDAGERMVVFSRWNSETQSAADFLAISAISGENREDLATKGERFILYRGDEAVYAAELCMDKQAWSLVPDAAYLRANFKLIYSEWITGLL